jgi:glucose-6-phosphate dehydrogenase assembly protein OpcA
VPGQPERLVALKRRDFTELISEELRRMDPDQIYERAVKSLLDGEEQTTKTAAARSTSGKREKKTGRPRTTAKTTARGR